MFMNQERKDLAVFIFLVICWIIMSVTPLAFPRTGRLFADYHDLTVYFERGKWLVKGVPATSEYPQIPTWLFGVDRWLVSWFPEQSQMLLYIAIFQYEMILTLFLTYRTLARLSHNAAHAALMLLPPVVYFSYSRFDILPAFLSLMAYLEASRKRWGMAAFWLAIATFTKWYPALLFPGFFVYAMYAEGRIKWQMLSTFIAVSSMILLASYLQGGWVALVAPYLFHTGRGMEYIAFPKLIYGLISRHWLVSLDVYYIALFVLQIVASPLLILFVRINSLRKLVYYGIVVIDMFILFSRIWSLQWFLWSLPLLLLVIEGHRDVFMVVLFTIVVFAGFPVAFDLFGPDSIQLIVIGTIYYAMLLVFIVQSLFRMRAPPSEAQS